MLGNRRGSITIFVSIVISIIMAFVGVLVDATRVRMARPILAFAVEASLDSILAGYEETLKDLFGIFAMAKDDPDLLQEEFENYLSKILITELGIDKSTIGEDQYQRLLSDILGGERFNGEKFLELYDFNIEKTDLLREDNLTDVEVLRDQILDHMKFRAPKDWAKGFLQKLTGLKGIKKQTEIITEKVELDKNVDGMKKKMHELSIKVTSLNKFMENFQKVENHVDRFIFEKGMKINNQKFLPFLLEEIQKKEEEKAKSDSYDEEGNFIEDLGLKRQIENLKSDRETLLENVARREELASKENESIQNMINEYGRDAEEIRNFVQEIKMDMTRVEKDLDSLQKIVEKDSSDFGHTINKDLETSREVINLEDFKKLDMEMSENMNQLNRLEKAIFRNLLVEERDIQRKFEPEQAKRFNELSKDPIEIQKSIAQIVYKGNYYMENFVYALKPLSFTRVQLKSTGGGENKIQEIRKVVDEKELEPLIVEKSLDDERNKEFNNLKDRLPAGEKTEGDLVQTSFQNNFDGVRNIGSGVLKDSSNLFDIFDRDLSTHKNELYVNEYVLSLFKHATSLKEEEWELDFRGKSKDLRNTFFEKAEVEYIIGGIGSENSNIAMVSAQIFLMRFALNSIYVYSNPEFQKTALAIASSTSGWWSGGLGIPVVYNLILITLAFSESVIDVKFLLRGKNVPVFKTRNTWVIGIGGTKDLLIQEAEKKALDFGNRGFDFLADSVDEMKEKSFGILEDTINEQIELTIDKAFLPLETLVLKAENYVQGMTEEIRTDDFVDEALPGSDRERVNFLMDEVYKIAKMNAQSNLDQMKGQILDLGSENFYSEIGRIGEEIKNLKETSKKQVEDLISGVLNDLKKELGDQIEKIKEQGNEQMENALGDFFSKLQYNATGTQGEINHKIGNRLLSFYYKDYLRILLLRVNSDRKIQRIQHLVQLNMRKQKGYEEFLLEDFYARLDVTTQVSMKYMFVTGIFVPKSFKTTQGNRHNLKIQDSRGY